MSDAGPGGAVLRLEAPAPVRGVALVAGGTRVSALLPGMRIATWSCPDGRSLGEVTYRGPPPTGAAINAAGDRLAIATADGKVRILDAATLESRAELPPARSARAQLTFSRDGTLLAGLAPGRHLDLSVWNVGAAKLLPPFADSALEPDSIAFHPDGRTAAISLLTGDVLVLDLTSARPVRTLPDALMTSDGLAFSSDGSVLVAAAFDGTVLVWQAARGTARRVRGIPGENSLAVAPDGSQAIVSRTSFNPRETPAEAQLIDLGANRVLARASLGIASSADVALLGRGRARVVSARGTTVELRDLVG
jgi:sugar lactone lactonase YvrE